MSQNIYIKKKLYVFVDVFIFMHFDWIHCLSKNVCKYSLKKMSINNIPSKKNVYKY